jgi:phosphatidyl-myo-inositol alpha-mannosyltransferase
MRIVQVCPYSWEAPGGVQAHIRQVSQHLRQRGHDVLVLAPGDQPEGYEGVRIVGKPVAVRFNGSVARICLSPGASRKVREALREFRPDVIHAHDPVSPGISMLALVHANAPLVATSHPYFPPDARSSKVFSFAAPLLRPIWRRVDRRLAVSNAARHTICSRLGYGNVQVLPNGANVDVFARALPARLPAGRKLLFVGRLELRKGFPVAVRAFSKLAAEYPDLRLVVVGDGADRDAVNELDEATRRRVDMMGRVTDEALPTFYRASDIFMSPATGSESFGIVLVEAMAAGIPLVASDIPGYREVARDGIEGILVPPSDPDALAAGIRRLLDDPALAMSLGLNGAQRARHFDWESIVDRLEDIYLETAGRDTRERESELAEV